MTQLTFDLELDNPAWEPIVKVLGGGLGEYIKDDRCRDCGAKGAYNQGGAGNGVAFMVCDRCAEIDSCRLQICTPILERRKVPNFTVDELAHCETCPWFVLDRSGWDDNFNADDLTDVLAEHAQPRHVSHWGNSHPVEKHDRLVRAQAERRAAYLKAVAA